jgi:ketosteroid isomerase-like protein
MSQANIEIAKNGYASFQRGDIAAILATLADDVEWITPGEGFPIAGTRHGVAEVAQFFEIVASTWDFTAFEPREYVDAGDTVVAIGSYAAVARETGKPISSEWVMVWKIRDGKVAHFREYTDTQALAGALTKAMTA